MYYKDVQEHPTWLMTSLFMEQRFEEHVKNLYKVLPRLKDKGRKLNRDKCQLRLHKLTYFGHELSGRGMFASEEKYSSKFIPDFDTVAEPLRKLTHKEQAFTWGKEQEKSFQELKCLMKNAEVLAYFKNECKTRIVADASPTGIGAVLLQCLDGEWRAVSLREQVLKLAHEEHQGIVTTKSRLRTKVWWPKIDSDAERLCKSYHGCQVVGQFQPPEPMKCAEFPTGPCQGVAADLMGPLPSGENIVAVVDYYSRFFEFRCQDSNDYLADHGIEHRKSPPLWPQANGEVERQNRTLLKSLRIAQVKKKPWRARPETGAIPSNISPGDKVLVKEKKTTGKLTPNFEKVPLTVICKKGAEVTVQADDGTEFKRNSRFVKPYIGEKKEEPIKAVETGPIERPRREEGQKD
ncbi:Uncharacterized protein K02A2.6 [Exaiptasia diaphana]|nr:Uncharacterized protein K02A2.6 [Exaiptasia diaphana]